ncbi:MAG: glycosyltransferase, partial [Armatimonadota bacterium]|nr:glycosyltransferase [Armatimonadota bacterium]
LAIEQKIDVFHGHDYKANFYGYLALRNLPVPLIATNHGYEQQGLRLALYQFLDSRLLRRMDAIVAVAESVAEAMARRGIPRDRVTIIRNGLDPQAFVSPSLSPERKRQLRADLGVPDGRRIIGCVGRLEHQKGYDVLLIAFARLLAEAPDLHLVIVGDGSLRDVLGAQARELGVTDHVTFAGVRPDVTSILRVFSLFVSSSRSEGMPMAVLEAAALELPIVATAVGDVPYLIEDDLTGNLAPPGDPAALARAIDGVLGQPDRTPRLGASAAERVRTRFSALESARQTRALYWRVLARAPAHRAPEAQPNE